MITMLLFNPRLTLYLTITDSYSNYIMSPSENIYIVDTHNEIPIVLFKELDKTTVESVDFHWDYITEITNGKAFYLIVDLSEATPPSAEVRFALKKRYMDIMDSIIYTNVVVGKNFLLKIVVRLVAATIGAENYNITSNIKLAIENITNKR